MKEIKIKITKKLGKDLSRDSLITEIIKNKYCCTPNQSSDDAVALDTKQSLKFHSIPFRYEKVGNEHFFYLEDSRFSRNAIHDLCISNEALYSIVD